VPKTSVACNHNQLQTDSILRPSYAIAKPERESASIASTFLVGSAQI
jgi:hypothetical protein